MDNLFVADVSSHRRCFAVSVDFAEIGTFDAIEADSKLAGWEVLVLLDVDYSLDDLPCDQADVVS